MQRLVAARFQAVGTRAACKSVGTAQRRTQGRPVVTHQSQGAQAAARTCQLDPALACDPAREFRFDGLGFPPNRVGERLEERIDAVRRQGIDRILQYPAVTQYAQASSRGFERRLFTAPGRLSQYGPEQQQVGAALFEVATQGMDGLVTDRGRGEQAQARLEPL